VTQQHALTDPQLLELCRQGREDGWEQLVLRYERLVFSIPLNYGLTRADAADVSQHAFTSLVEHLDRLRPDSNLGGWLATVARHHALRLIRQRQREMLGQEEDVAESPLLANVSDGSATAHWERVDWLNQGLELLDERCRKLLLLLYFSEEQPAYEEVAAALDLRVGSVGPIRGRCLGRLRAILVERDT
jgi:RNA polymerase sigma factor (sigma-70 family)